MTTNTKKKNYYNHKILLGDGSIFIDARTDHRTPKQLMDNAKKPGSHPFEVYSLIREHGVMTVEIVGEANDKWTSIARKKPLKDAYESLGIKVRNNPRTEGMTEEELEKADIENKLKVI